MKRLLTSLLSFVLLFSNINVNALSNDNISTYTNEFNLIANNGLGAINLDWSSYNGNNVTFKGYSSNDGGQTYQSISLMDYTSVKDVKVLNIYPDIGDGLKSWMEDISMSSTGTPIGKGIIHVDKVPISDFNQNVQNYLYKINGEWNYDVIVFGFWDRNNCRDLSTSSKDVVDKFISDGGGCIFGHDVALNNAILATDTYEYTSGPIKNGQNNFDYLARKYFPFMSYKANNYIGWSTVYVTKKVCLLLILII